MRIVNRIEGRWSRGPERPFSAEQVEHARRLVELHPDALYHEVAGAHLIVVVLAPTAAAVALLGRLVEGLDDRG